MTNDMKILVGAAVVLGTIVLFSKPAKAKSDQNGNVRVTVGPSKIETPIDNKPPVNRPFADLPIGTFVSLDGFDEAFKIIAKNPSQGSGLWFYNVVEEPAPLDGAPARMSINENDIEELFV